MHKNINCTIHMIGKQEKIIHKQTHAKNREIK